MVDSDEENVRGVIGRLDGTVGSVSERTIACRGRPEVGETTEQADDRPPEVWTAAAGGGLVGEL